LEIEVDQLRGIVHKLENHIASQGLPPFRSPGEVQEAYMSPAPDLHILPGESPEDYSKRVNAVEVEERLRNESMRLKLRRD
jgi:hypothetical protein